MRHFHEPGTQPVALELKSQTGTLRDVWRDGTFEGYASVFGDEDLGHDVIERGAFRASLQMRGPSGVRLLYQHDPGQPIGVWERIYEDARGLFVRGRLNPHVARARETLALMRDGAIDGLSIGFKATRARRDRVSGVRRLLAVDLWEISVVTFPMQPRARISGAGHTDPALAPPAAGRRADDARLLLRVAERARALKTSTPSRGQ